MEYNIKIEGEPTEVTEIRSRILSEFKDLIFTEEGHKYTLFGESVPSVSSIAHKFEEPFDELGVATIYAEKHGETPEYWLNKWHENSFKATTQGTRVHAYGESLGWFKNGHPELIVPEILPQYNKENNWLVPIHPKEEAIVKFIDDLPDSYHLVLNEARVYSGKNPNPDKNPSERYCGTFDMLFWYDGNGNPEKSGLVLMDYKTNKSFVNDFARSKNKMLLEPFNDMYAESLGNYTIQLSCYAIPLQDLGYKILDRKIIWLKPDGNYEKISVPDITDKLRNVL